MNQLKGIAKDCHIDSKCKMKSENVKGREKEKEKDLDWVGTV